jgi:hypothetical protein
MSNATLPIKLTEYLHGEKFWETDTPAKLKEQGVSEEVLEKFRYLVYELELAVELHENGDVHITHVAGQKLNQPIINT